MNEDHYRRVEARLRPSTPLSTWTHINTGEADAEERLKAFGIEIEGPDRLGSHDFFMRRPAARETTWSIIFDRSEQCLFVIEEPEHYSATAFVIGSRNTFAAVGSPNMPGSIVIGAEYHGHDNCILWGDGSTSNGCRIIVQGARTVEIGADCMLADEITIRTTDNHAIFDAESGEVLNRTRDVVLGPHVWLGHGAAIGKGVTIGVGTVVGARSLVTRSLPAGVLAYGAPAEVVRKGIGWTRNITPSEQEKQQALSFLGA